MAVMKPPFSGQLLGRHKEKADGGTRPPQFGRSSSEEQSQLMEHRPPEEQDDASEDQHQHDDDDRLKVRFDVEDVRNGDQCRNA